MTEQTPEALVSAATTEQTFDFAQAVMDRAYPEFDVQILLDEDHAAQYIEKRDQIEPLDIAIAKAADPKRKKALIAEQQKIVAEVDELHGEMRKQMYTVHIKGISTERVEEIQNEALEQFPIEHEESVSPITGATNRVEIPSEKRERYFTTLLRHAHVVSITSPSGARSRALTVDEFGASWARMPLAARNQIDRAINKASMTVDYYRDVVDEVF